MKTEEIHCVRYNLHAMGKKDVKFLNPNSETFQNT